MQSVQRTFLTTTIHPGEKPIFIIVPKLEDGFYLATLLSLNLSPATSFARLSGIINEDNNYFFSDPVKKLLPTSFEVQQIKELQIKVQLALDEGMSNGKLWGLIVTQKNFTTLQFDTLFPDAFYFFLYDSHSSDLITNNEELIQRSIIAHKLLVQELSEILLQNLSLNSSTKLLPYQQLILTNKKKKNKKSVEEEINIRNEILCRYDFFNTHWINGHNCHFILFLSHETDERHLLQKIKAIQNSFVDAPIISVITKKEIHNDLFQSLNITIQVVSFSNYSNCVNQLIQDTSSEIVVIDNGNYRYSVYHLLKELFQENAPKFTSVIVAATKNKVVLSDVLTHHLIDDVIAFSREKWKTQHGMDEQIHDANTLWDFAIRLLLHENDFGTIIPGNVIGEQRQVAKVLSPDYEKVLQKHLLLFTSKLNDVIRIISDTQHAPLIEIKSLQNKIATQQSLLTHSRDELKSLNELSATLQHRINLLEQRLIYRLGKKLNRIKKIFFKKKSPGIGTLKRMLLFLRFAMSKAGFTIVRKIVRNVLKKLYLIAEDRPVRIVLLDEINEHHFATYHDWVMNKLNPKKLKEVFDEEQQLLKWQPKISVIMPVYDAPLPYLRQAIESVINQQYSHWELCIADDCSPNHKVQKLLQSYEAKDSRIKVVYRNENGHISAASNSALALAEGDFVLLMDHDDLLSENCMFEVVKHLNQFAEDEIIYSDEDKIDEESTHTMPHFKPNWAPHNLLSRNYFGHVVVIKKQIIDAIGGFRIGFEGSQDYDLLLRATEVSNRIGHIPKVLYHWRIHNKSAAQSEEVKPYAYIAAKKALEEALQRRNTQGTVHYLSGLRGYRIRYDIEKQGKVSIVIPTKDQVQLLKNTIDSIIKLTQYKDYEIILLNNNSTSKEFFDFVAVYTKKFPEIFHCIEANFPFNFARLMNVGVAASKGDYILFLNNDMEVIQEDWLNIMVSHAQHKNTGAVGVKLLYPDDHIQHAGVIVGLGGVAGHAFVHAFKDDPGYFNYIQSMNNFSAVTAACLLFRKEIYSEVDGMSEEFEVEYNDVDFCLKIMKAGYYNVYLPDVELYHFESSTRGHPHQSKASWERHVREIALFKNKWQHIIDADPYYNPNLNIGAHDFRLNFSA